MLIETFYKMAMYEDDDNVVYNWIRSISPKRCPGAPQLQNELIVFPFHNEESLHWNDLELLASLHTTNPRYAVPLLWELCLHYDEYYESSEVLRKYCKKQVGSGFEGVAFYRKNSFLCLASKSKVPSKKCEGIDVFVDKNKLLVTLWPTTGVQRVLADQLGESALGVQADCLRQMLPSKGST